MQAVLAIPSSETIRRHGAAEDVLMQEVAGVPLLVRAIATAARANVDSVLVIWPHDINPLLLESCIESPLLKGVQFDSLVVPSAFDPRSASDWAAIDLILSDKFLWLPWNWVTHKRALAVLSPSTARPVTWQQPVLLEKFAVLDNSHFRLSVGEQTSGISVTSPSTARTAERFLVANSGKPTDGIYSKFNRFLCRHVVRLLSHTGITPNAITLAGLAVAIVGAFLFARGNYVNYVAGALLFFVSGLIDEMDGMIARIKFLESAFGTWFEGFVDNLTYLAVFLGIIVGLYREYGNFALMYGTALIIGCVLSIAVIAWQRKLATTRGRPHEYAGKMNQLMEADSSNLVSLIVRQVHIFVKKGVLVHWLLWFTLLGHLHMFLWLAAIGSNVTWIIALHFTRRFFQHPRVTTADNISTAA
ncbi:MAG: CDP-alcohol phosphatidyltransferase family protein [Bryobacterales bacterium]|nr:CDP-alcohol phosphatidyltransferase family protein [Bryobacterales bacterium]